MNAKLNTNLLSQLIYVSVRKSDCSDEEIDNILASSQRNNKDTNITGVLLYSKNKFLQVLEGDKDKVLKLYDDIKTDNRHTSVIMISLKSINERFFPSWQMGSKKIDTSSYDFLTSMSADEQQEFRTILSGSPSETAIRVINKLF